MRAADDTPVDEDDPAFHGWVEITLAPRSVPVPPRLLSHSSPAPAGVAGLEIVGKAWSEASAEAVMLMTDQMRVLSSRF